MRHKDCDAILGTSSDVSVKIGKRERPGGFESKDSGGRWPKYSKVLAHAHDYVHMRDDRSRIIHA